MDLIRPVRAAEAAHDLTCEPVEFTSWSRESDERWNAFRIAVRAGTDAHQAARSAGLPMLEVPR